MTRQAYLNYIDRIVQQIRGNVQVYHWEFDDSQLDKQLGVVLHLTKRGFDATIKLDVTAADVEETNVCDYRDYILLKFNDLMKG